MKKVSFSFLEGLIKNQGQPLGWDSLDRSKNMLIRTIVKITVLAVLLSGSAALGDSVGEELASPNEKIRIMFANDNGGIVYSVSLDGNMIIRQSSLGLKKNAAQPLEIAEVTRSSADVSWESVWGIQKTNHDTYNEIQLKVEGASAQTIIFRAYDDGVAFRYQLPASGRFSDAAYAYESSQVAFVSETPTAWYPLSTVLVSDAVDVNTWEPAGKKQKKPSKNTRYTFKPSVIETPFTLKLSDLAYISVHEAAVIQSDMAGLQLTDNTLTFVGNNKTAGGHITPWRTITITDRAGGLIESSLIVNLNEPSKIKDTSWIKPGVTMWDWRNHGAHADDGFEYGLNTESYIRYIDFAAEHGIEYMLIDAEWYGPERSSKSDPKTYLPQIDIPKICAYAQSKGVGMWLYINTKALQAFDMDATFKQFKAWGVVGIKQGFGASPTRKSIEFDLSVVKKSAAHELMYIRHETPKGTGYERTYPNVMAYEFVNSMLDGGSRPPATPSRVINGLFVFGLAGPADRSCGMFDLDSFIAREKCHRQLPSTVVSQTAQCLLYPSGLLTLPDMPDAYQRKADLFEFIGQLPMNWDETNVLEAEIGQYITLARRAGDQWFVGSLADEQGRETSVTLDFLEEGVVYDVTLYEDAPDANYEYIGPMNKQEAKRAGQELKPQKTRRELYQVKKVSAQKGDVIPVLIAPGGGHCMWIRPAK
jgi:alpha-glucosidase